VTLRQNGVDTGAMELDGVDDTIVDGIVVDDGTGVTEESLVADNVLANDDVEEAVGELMLVLDAVELIVVIVAGAMMEGVVELDNVLVVSVDDIVDD
jgi:hypothetical protein